jgi:hypothetical protein
MANVYAVKSGDWSDPTVWNTGALPTSADDVFSNSFTVTVDVSVSVLTVKNSAASPIVAGGTFLLSDGITLTAQNSLNGTDLIQLNANAPAIAGAIASASGATSYVIRNNGTGTLNLTGTYSGSGGAANRTPIGNISTGTINITGTLNAGSSANCNGAINLSTGTINVVGNCNAATAGDGLRGGVRADSGTVVVTGNVYGLSSANSYGALVTSTGVLTINGFAFGGTGAGSAGAFSTGTGTLNMNGDATAGTGGPAIASNSLTAQNILSGPLINNGRISAIYCARFRFKPGTAARWRIFQRNGDGLDIIDRTLYTAGDYPDMPAPADVRAATAFGPGSTLTGALAMPAPSSVRSGVPTDNTVGTATLDAAAFWDALIANMNTSGSIGARLKNAATVETTGDQWATG